MPRSSNSHPRRQMLSLCLALGFGCAGALPALSEQVELTPAQKTLLELQLKEHYKCELTEVLFSREIEIGGRKELEGRVRCRDQREVDFVQHGDHQKFELKLCMPTVC